MKANTINSCSCCSGLLHDISNDLEPISTAELAGRLGATIFVSYTIPEIIDIVEDYKAGIISGTYTTRNLPEVWYDAYYSSFMNEAVTAQGIVGTPTAGQLMTLEGYNKNLYEFSSAKLYQQQISLEAIPTDLSDEDFNTVFNSRLNQNSVNWSKTEQITIFQNSNANSLWQKIVESKDVLPYLQYITVGDERVRPSHNAMNGIIKPVNDSFWDTHNPSNGFNCRCTVVQIARPDSAIIPEAEYDPKKAYPDEGFGVNWGKVDYVLPKDHSYTKVRKGDKALKENNFNLPPKTLQ